MRSSGGLEMLEKAWPYGISGWLYYPIVDWGMSLAFYFAILILLASLLVAWTIKPFFRPEKNRRKDDLLYLLFLLSTIIWGRWPSFVGTELNPDESQSLAGASLLSLNPVPFVSVDGTTHGPLLYAPLLIGKMFGLPLDYGLARVVGLFACLVAVVCTFLLVGHFYDSRSARVAVLIIGFLEAVSSNSAILACSSETIPMAVLFMVLVIGWEADGLKIGLFGRAFLSGVLLSSLAYIKLQFVPIGVVVAVGWLWHVRVAHPDRSFSKLAATLVASAFVLPALITVVVVVNGGWNDFWQGYILANRVYTQHVRFHDMNTTSFFDADSYPLSQRFWRTYYRFVRHQAEIRWFLRGAFLSATVMLVALGLRSSDPDRTRKLSAPSAMTGATVLLAICLFVVVLPGNAYEHYFRIFFVPTGLWFGCLFGEWLVRKPKSKVPLLLILPLLVPFLAERVYNTGENWRRFNPEILFREGPSFLKAPPLNSASAEVLHFVRPGEKISVWGWDPAIYVLSQTYPATRDIVGERLMEDRFDLSFYRSRYLRELSQNPPPAFIDAVGGFMYKDPKLYGLQTFPELVDFLTRNYVLAVSRAEYKIWVRRDRLAELQQAQSSGK